MKQIFVFLFLAGFSGSMVAQHFAQPVEIFSKKKPAYITLKSGEEVECTIKKISRKKGLIKEIMIIVDDEKVTYPAEDVQHMYLPQSGLDKMNKSANNFYDLTTWDNEDINGEYMKEGYAYFEQSEAQLKKNKVEVIMQVLNPAFAKKVKIYHDPWANETASASIGGFKVGGGVDKSYYMKIGDEIAEKIHKKNYLESWDRIYSDCPELTESMEEGWSKFGENLMNYSMECK